MYALTTVLPLDPLHRECDSLNEDTVMEQDSQGLDAVMEWDGCFQSLDTALMAQVSGPLVHLVQ